jgi:hypothetical protein
MSKTKEKEKKSSSRNTSTTVSKPRKKKTGMLYDMDVRELLVMIVAANFLVDGLILLILVTKLYL